MPSGRTGGRSDELAGVHHVRAGAGGDPEVEADGLGVLPFPYTGAARLLERPRAKPPETTSEGVDTHG